MAFAMKCDRCGKYYEYCDRSISAESFDEWITKSVWTKRRKKMTNNYDNYDAAQTVYTFMYNCMFNKGSAEYAWFNERTSEGMELSEDTNILKLMADYVTWGARRFF